MKEAQPSARLSRLAQIQITGSTAGAQQVAISLQNTVKSFGADAATVGPINLDIFDGEFLTLLGPSGSDKTTTLMLLAGLQQPSSGDILLGGNSIKNVPPNRRNFGVMFQDYALFPHMTVAENIAFPLIQRKASKTEIAQEVQKIGEMVEVGHLLERRISQLSGGQKQRVALARTLVFKPKVVLLDEPLGAVDKRLREQMQVELRRIHRQLGTTFISVTHDQDEALSLSDRIVVFNHGNIEQVASPEDIYRNPSTLFVANFLGDNNNLSGIVEQVSVDYCVVRLQNGGLTRCRLGNPVFKGAPVNVAVRPEAISVLKTEGAGNTRTDATLVDRVYRGDHWSLTMVADNNMELHAKVFGSRLQDVITVGAQVTASWSQLDAIAFTAG